MAAGVGKWRKRWGLLQMWQVLHDHARGLAATSAMSVLSVSYPATRGNSQGKCENWWVWGLETDITDISDKTALSWNAP